MAKQGGTPIVDEQRFILATRDTGYRTTAAAIAELVDNAVQACASIVRIFVNQTGTGTEREITVAVLDNGSGMDRETLSTAMQFAGSSRFNDRTGLGRFGMGLPNSSVSQARRVDVYTWQTRKRVLHTYLDVDEISNGKLRSVPRPRPAEIPDWAEKHARKQTGTLIGWTRCDRLDYRKSSTIVDKLQRPLGQRFRYFLWSGNKIYINNYLVKPVDPLFVQMDSELPPARAFGDVLPFEFRVPTNSNRTSIVRVRFSELPVDAWHDLPAESKRTLGVAKGAGVSVVRAGREIDYGWYFMGGKRKENYDDWWRCEVAFDPELDELFGVTHSKQDINPTAVLRVELSQSLEGIAHSLNSRARHAFTIVKSRTESPRSASELVAVEKEPSLPPLAVGNEGKANGSQPRASTKKLDYRITPAPLNLPDLYLWDLKSNGQVVITLNTNHTFIERVLSASHGESTLRHAIECLLIAMVRAELSMPTKARETVLAQFRVSFSNVLASYIGD